MFKEDLDNIHDTWLLDNEEETATEESQLQDIHPSRFAGTNTWWVWCRWNYGGIHVPKIAPETYECTTGDPLPILFVSPAKMKHIRRNTFISSVSIRRNVHLYTPDPCLHVHQEKTRTRHTHVYTLDHCPHVHPGEYHLHQIIVYTMDHRPFVHQEETRTRVLLQQHTVSLTNLLLLHHQHGKLGH